MQNRRVAGRKSNNKYILYFVFSLKTGTEIEWYSDEGNVFRSYMEIQTSASPMKLANLESGKKMKQCIVKSTIDPCSYVGNNPAKIFGDFDLVGYEYVFLNQVETLNKGDVSSIRVGMIFNDRSIEYMYDLSTGKYTLDSSSKENDDLKGLLKFADSKKAVFV